MTTNYPIIDRRKLNSAEKAGLFRKKSRTDGELLKPDAHHVLVYRVNGVHVLDGDRMRRTDEQVVDATHVSMVDMRRNAPVRVVLEIPSADTSQFEVVVTFVCTVIDAVAVVHGGVDAQEALWSYLQAHNQIFGLGMDFQLSQVNELRRAVSAQITAYTTIKPPTVPGMAVTMASVEVANPEYLAKYEEQHRGKDVEQRLAELEQENQHRLQAGQVLNDHSLETVKQEHTHRIADHDHSRDQTIATSDAQHRQQLADEQAAFERKQFNLQMDAIGRDPRRALTAAFVNGRIDASTLAERLRALDDQDEEMRQRKLALERDERRELLAAEREDRQWEREQQRLLSERQREDDLRREQQAREDEGNRLSMRLNLLKQAAEKGHFDMVNLQADRLYAEVMGLEPPAMETTTTPTLLAADAPVAEIESDADRTAQVREEDD